MDIKDALNGLKDKAQDVLDKTDIDDKIIDGAKKAKDKIKDAKLDEKLKDAAGKAKDAAQGVLDKTDIDEKIVDAATKAKDKAADAVSDLKDKIQK